MRQVRARPDPDQRARLVTLPVTWDDRAADALAALVPGEGPVSLAASAAVWLTMLAARARQAGQDPDITLGVQALLRQRQAAPNRAIWASEPGMPGFRLNAAAFHHAAIGFDVVGFAGAASLTAQACQLLAPAAPAYEIGLAGLDDLLACLGIDYDSRAARELAACLAALLRGRVELALESDQRDLLATPAPWPAPPRACVIPGLAEAAAAARAAVCRAPGAKHATGIFPAGPSEALLGIETGGIAPAFSAVRDQHLTRAAQHRLAAAAMSPEAALAAVLAGENPLPLAGLEAHAAMHAAMAPYLETMPPLPASLPAPDGQAAQAARPGPAHRALPARHTGLTQKVLLGGHRVYLRTGEYADGTLGEITLSLPRESAAVRGLAEGFAHAVSIGLQHGVKLQDYIEAFSLTRFGFAGSVEGDPDVTAATSVLDYVFRTLSATYLGRRLPEPEMEEAPAPLLPLDLPQGGRRRLRLVA
jgi:hypothetical protein